MSTKTITLAGSEIKAEFSGSNAWFRNDGADVIYAAAKPGITAGADGVVAIPAGQSAPVYGANGAVWLTGTGSVQLIGSDYSTNPFKSSVTSGSVAAQIARAVSNPNLLINPDFRINQRGQTEYTASGYTVDRWQIGGSAKLTPHDGYITFESIVDKATPPLYQIVENPAALNGKTVVLSFDCDLKTEGAWISVQSVTNGSRNPSSYVPIYDTGRSIKSTVITLPENLTDLRLALVIHGTDSAPLAAVDIYGAKLELGEIATPIVPADPATELAKCQRYALKIVNGVQAVAYRILTNSISFYFPTTVTFRVNATSTADFAVQTGNSTEHSGFAFEFYTKPNGVIVEAKKTTHGITLSDSPILVCKTQGIFDAEL